MKHIRLNRLIILCFTLVPSLALGQTPEIEALKQEAEQGDAEAQFKLGWRYAIGDGVSEDTVEGVKWFRKGANQGNVGAQILLGKCYDGGIGIEQDHLLATKWYQKAANQGHPMAEYRIGIAYYAGVYGLPENVEEAFSWLRKAAEKGLPEAQSTLGKFYALDQDGSGLNDHKEAVKWLTRAALQGDVGAQLKLGYQYLEGKGVPEDYIQAYKWWNLSAASGNKDADHNKKVLAKKMTLEQIAKAQQITSEFRPLLEVASTPYTDLSKINIKTLKQTLSPEAKARMEAAKARLEQTRTVLEISRDRKKYMEIWRKFIDWNESFSSAIKKAKAEEVRYYLVLRLIGESTDFMNKNLRDIQSIQLQVTRKHSVEDGLAIKAKLIESSKRYLPALERYIPVLSNYKTITRNRKLISHANGLAEILKELKDVVSAIEQSEN
jgi:TPR repeat protein